MKLIDIDLAQLSPEQIDKLYHDLYNSMSFSTNKRLAIAEVFTFVSSEFYNLLPCANCGKEGAFLKGLDDMCKVCCTECSMNTDWCKTLAKGAEVWNRRPQDD